MIVAIHIKCVIRIQFIRNGKKSFSVNRTFETHHFKFNKLKYLHIKFINDSIQVAFIHHLSYVWGLQNRIYLEILREFDISLYVYWYHTKKSLCLLLWEVNSCLAFWFCTHIWINFRTVKFSQHRSMDSKDCEKVIFHFA